MRCNWETDRTYIEFGTPQLLSESNKRLNASVTSYSGAIHLRIVATWQSVVPLNPVWAY
jgi:hypothetical protein